MSLYEVLVFAALAGLFGFAYFLYRSDMRSKGTGGSGVAPESGSLMFGRERKDKDDGPQS